MILYGFDGVSAGKSVVVVLPGASFRASTLVMCSLSQMAQGGAVFLMKNIIHEARSAMHNIPLVMVCRT